MAHYGTEADFQAWLTANGFTLPVGADPAVLLNVGSAYIDAAYGARLTCSQRTGGFQQELEWPRRGHVINGELVPDDLIPQAWINAVYRAAYLQATTPGWANGSNDPNRVTRRERVDTIEREFMTANDRGVKVAAGSGVPTDALIDGMLTPWLCSTSRRFNDLFRVI